MQILRTLGALAEVLGLLLERRRLEQQDERDECRRIVLARAGGRCEYEGAIPEVRCGFLPGRRQLEVDELRGGSYRSMTMRRPSANSSIRSMTTFTAISATLMTRCSSLATTVKGTVRLASMSSQSPRMRSRRLASISRIRGEKV